MVFRKFLLNLLFMSCCMLFPLNLYHVNHNYFIVPVIYWVSTSKSSFKIILLGILWLPLIIIFKTLCEEEKVNYSSTCLLVSLNCQQDTVLWHLREKPQLRHFLDHIGQPVYFSGGLFACFLAIYGKTQLSFDGTLSIQAVLNHIVGSKLVY